MTSENEIFEILWLQRLRRVFVFDLSVPYLDFVSVILDLKDWDSNSWWCSGLFFVCDSEFWLRLSSLILSLIQDSVLLWDHNFVLADLWFWFYGYSRSSIAVLCSPSLVTCFSSFRHCICHLTCVHSS